MKYDFTSIMDRHGKDAIAVDGLGTGFAPAAPKEGFDAIPMWVADMNFPTVPTIQEAIIERTNHPAFGYFNPTDEYFDSIIRWQAKRNGVQGLTKECIGYENGVLGGVISPMQGISPSDLKIDLLCERIAAGGVREVILAISTSVEGETTLFYLMNRLRQYPGLKITAIARGIGFGDELEYVDELTITHALLNRREIE